MLSDLLFRVRGLFRSRAAEAEWEDELRFHVESQFEVSEIGVDARRSTAARADGVWRIRSGEGGVPRCARGLPDRNRVLMAKLLFSVSAVDPPTFAAVAIGLALIAMLACYIPAHRTLRIDPLIALRHE